jgi:hypothetical protein
LDWSWLDLDQRATIDAEIWKWGTPEQFQIYEHFRKALSDWEFIQDMQGM